LQNNLTNLEKNKKNLVNQKKNCIFAIATTITVMSVAILNKQRQSIDYEIL